MNKKQLLQSAWIKYEIRQPPDTDEKIWYVTESGSFGISNGNIINSQKYQIAKLSEMKEVVKKDSGYFVKYWQKCIPPKEFENE